MSTRKPFPFDETMKAIRELTQQWNVMFPSRSLSPVEEQAVSLLEATEETSYSIFIILLSLWDGIRRGFHRAKMFHNIHEE